MNNLIGSQKAVSKEAAHVISYSSLLLLLHCFCCTRNIIFRLKRERNPRQLKPKQKRGCLREGREKLLIIRQLNVYRSVMLFGSSFVNPSNIKQGDYKIATGSSKIT